MLFGSDTAVMQSVLLISIIVALVHTVELKPLPMHVIVITITTELGNPCS